MSYCLLCLKLRQTSMLNMQVIGKTRGKLSATTVKDGKAMAERPC